MCLAINQSPTFSTPVSLAFFLIVFFVISLQEPIHFSSKLSLQCSMWPACKFTLYVSTVYTRSLMGLCDRRSCVQPQVHIYTRVHHGVYFSAMQKLFADNFLLTATNQNWSKLCKSSTQLGCGGF